MTESEGRARHAAQVAGFFEHHPEWVREPFTLPELPESLPSGVPPWESSDG